MVPPQSSNLQNLLEIGEIVENIYQILLLQTINASLCASLSWFVLILISNLKYVTSITNIASLIKGKKYILVVFVRYFNLAIINEKYTRADNIKSEDIFIRLKVFIWKRCYHLSHKFIISFKPKLRVNEKNIKSFLELKH